MVSSDTDGFTLVDARGPGVKRPVRASARKPARTDLPAIPHTTSRPQAAESARPSVDGAVSTKRKRSLRASRSPSVVERDELEEGPVRRYRKSASPKVAKYSAAKTIGKSNAKSTGKGKTKLNDERAKPKKVSKAALERARLEELRNDEHFGRLDEATIKRIAKAHHERLYLIHRFRDSTQLREGFDVMGSTGNVYKVCVGRQVSCTCMDFHLRRQVCKHLLFIYIKVMRLSGHLPIYTRIRLDDEEIQQVFDEARHDPIAEAMAKPELRKAWEVAVGYKPSDGSESSSTPEAACEGKRLIPEEGDVCGVCYEDLEPGSVEGLEFCLESCGRPIHVDCLETWFNTRGFARTCIWCRAIWRKTPSYVEHQADGYRIGLGSRGNVVNSSTGRQLNLADVAAVAETSADASAEVPTEAPGEALAEPSSTSGWE